MPAIARMVSIVALAALAPAAALAQSHALDRGSLLVGGGAGFRVFVF